MPKHFPVTYDSANGGRNTETEHTTRYEAQRRVKELNERGLNASFEDQWDGSKNYPSYNEPDLLENDTHPGMSTDSLLNYADRWTPRKERTGWVATQGYPKKLPDGSYEIQMHDPATGDEWIEGPFSSQVMRAYVEEQLNHYGLSQSEINYRRS
jgi:hypothetical protein